MAIAPNVVEMKEMSPLGRGTRCSQLITKEYMYILIALYSQHENILCTYVHTHIVLHIIYT